MRVLTVCLGNICRSPAAESVLTARLAAAGVEATVASAGTGPWHVGDPPHRLSRAEGEARGYAFTSVGHQFAPEDFDRADLVLAMDSANERDLLALARDGRDAATVVRLGAFAPGAQAGGHDAVRDVPDPYGGPREDFVAMYDQIEEAVDGLVAAVTEDRWEELVASYVAARGA